MSYDRDNYGPTSYDPASESGARVRGPIQPASTQRKETPFIDYYDKKMSELHQELLENKSLVEQIQGIIIGPVPTTEDLDSKTIGAPGLLDRITLQTNNIYDRICLSNNILRVIRNRIVSGV